METVATSKGQIVIPSVLRRKMNIKEGTRIQIDVDYEKNTILLIPITREYVMRLSGKYSDKELVNAIKDIDS